MVKPEPYPCTAVNFHISKGPDAKSNAHVALPFTCIQSSSYEFQAYSTKRLVVFLNSVTRCLPDAQTAFCVSLSAVWGIANEKPFTFYKTVTATHLVSVDAT